MILRCQTTDFQQIHEIINDAAIAYKDIIPADRWHEPYMPENELQHQISEGVEFWKFMEEDRIAPEHPFSLEPGQLPPGPFNFIKNTASGNYQEKKRMNYCANTGHFLKDRLKLQLF